MDLLRLLDNWKFLVTIFFFFFFRVLFWELDGDSWKFLVTFLFFLSFFKSLTYYYLARDSCKKWQEIIDKLGLISKIDQLPTFSSLFFFLFFNLHYCVKLGRTVENFSSLFFFLLFFFRMIFANWTETAENFSSLFCFFFFCPLLTYSRAG